MAKENIFIKRTAIIETLGSATVIASDKTGTLTLNQMTVENVWSNRIFSSAAKVLLRRVAADLSRAAPSRLLRH
jgi:P-type Ca2+ transporter type 2C